MSQEYILAIDQGTTGTTAVLVDRGGQIRSAAYREITQIYPNPGWVEHDPHEIWESVRKVVSELTASAGGRIRALGITNQRETTVVWQRGSGEPVGNAIVWQCRRTADMCRGLKPYEEVFRTKTGLPVDPYFSGTKLRWILDQEGVPDPGELCFGTIDSWLIWKLTGGARHVTDFTNASRTLLFNIKDKQWDAELCGLLGVPTDMLPQVRRSIDDFGAAEGLAGIDGIPILGVAGDQQAALFGQAGFASGSIKNTYGTGCFLLMNTGTDYVASRKGLLTTLAVDGTGSPCFALEGSVFIGGAALQWLRDEVGILAASSDSESAARSVEDNAGVYMVPAFVGLGAPHWDMEVRGLITGLTRGANRSHIIRAALESMAYQTRDMLALMEKEAGVVVAQLATDGGAASNDFLLQFQADILDLPVARPAVIESTSLGAAFLAGLGCGFWQDAEELSRTRVLERVFKPDMEPGTRAELLAGWEKALRQAMTA
ncbi:MAG: glycerol kinase GlpK [Candidatus Aminicenantaceae bacterium]